MCSFVIKVKGKDIELLLEDVCSIEENEDKVRAINSGIFILANFLPEIK